MLSLLNWNHHGTNSRQRPSTIYFQIYVLDINILLGGLTLQSRRPPSPSFIWLNLKIHFLYIWYHNFNHSVLYVIRMLHSKQPTPTVSDSSGYVCSIHPIMISFIQPPVLYIAGIRRHRQYRYIDSFAINLLSSYLILRTTDKSGSVFMGERSYVCYLIGTPIVRIAGTCRHRQFLIYLLW